MTKRTLLTMLMTAALACGIASGETKVNLGDATVTIDVRVGGAKADGGWLGVRIMPVPAPLAAHLKTKDTGVMVGNLVKDSPAHKAGLRRYDVIVGMDGKAVENGPALVKGVGDHKAGDKVDLSIIRKGGKMTLQVTLGKPGPADQAKLVHKEDAPAAWQDVLRMHPRVIFRKGAGNWERMDGKNLPEDIRKLMKSLPEMKIDADGPNVRISTKTVIRRKDAEGRDIQFEQDETGQITITKKTVGADGKETEAVSKYKDMGALEKMDKEAHELFKHSRTRVFPGIGIGRRFKLEIPRHKPFGGAGAIDAHRLQKEIHEQLRKSLDQMNLPDDLRKKLKEQIEKSIRAGRGDGGKKKIENTPPV